MILKNNARKLQKVWRHQDTPNFRYFHDQISKGTMDFFTLEEKEEVIGELYALYDSVDPDEADGEKRAYLLAFRVRPAFQNQGHGKRLMLKVIEILEAKGISEITIGIDPAEYDKLYGMYNRWGFNEVVKDMYVDYHCFNGDGSPYRFEKPSKLLIRRSYGR